MKYLVVGHGAREHCITRRLRGEGHQVIGYSTKANIGIEKDATDVVRAADYNAQAIVTHALARSVDCILPVNESSLFDGVVDLAGKAGLRAYGPDRRAARLEYDKAFAKDLVRAIDPSIVLEQHRFVGCEDAMVFLQQNPGRWFVRLEDGAGRYGIIRWDGEIVAHQELLRDIHEGRGATQTVLIEEWIQGIDFSVPAFVSADAMRFGPVIRDYPFRNDGNAGEKTGGMGAVAGSGLLPYVSSEDYGRAQACIEATLKRMRAPRERVPAMLCMGQFLKTGNGIVFVEFDVRPGDPEILPLLSLLMSPLSEVVESSIQGQVIPLRFEARTSVAVAFVPPYYPNRDGSPIRINVDEKAIRLAGCELLIGNVASKDGQLWTGDSRSLVVVGTDDTMEIAHTKVMSAAREIDPQLHCRRDIGVL